jgi:hypothetical protein
MLLFDAFLVSKKIAHSIRRSVIGKMSLHARTYRFSVDALPKRLPRNIWMYWNTPLEHAPPIVQASVASWVRKNPTWTVKILSDENVEQFAHVPNPKGPRKIQWKADLIRVSLLRDFGGVWTDASTFCVKPLDEWLPPLMQSGFFAFQGTNGRIMRNWFMAAAPNNHLVDKWFRMMLRYYSKPGKLGHYFWSMYMFAYVVRTDRRAAAIWNLTPRISGKGPSILKRLVAQPELAEPIPEYVDELAIPVLKISSSNKSTDPEFNDAIARQRDFSLRKMADSAAAKQLQSTQQ